MFVSIVLFVYIPQIVTLPWEHFSDMEIFLANHKIRRAKMFAQNLYAGKMGRMKCTFVEDFDLKCMIFLAKRFSGLHGAFYILKDSKYLPF